MPINIQWGSLFEPCKLILKLMHKNNKTTLGRKKNVEGVTQQTSRLTIK